MLQELLNKEVTIHMGILASFTDQYKGTLIEIGENWIKLRTKKNVEYINLQKIAKVVIRQV